MTVLERIMAKVTKTDRCWLWTGAATARGYGTIKVGGITVLAHRVLWELTNGRIPDGLNLCHRCDTPACVRPECHFVGTQAENLEDMRRKGRSTAPPRHEKVPPAGVLDIRTSVEPTRVLVRRYGISREQVRKIRNGESRAAVSTTEGAQR